MFIFVELTKYNNMEIINDTKDQHSSRDEIKTELVTPEKAKEYLLMNSSVNKKLNEDKISRIANCIRNGEWDPKGDFIYFVNNATTLINGQHRMHAIIRANIPVYINVVRIYEE